MLNLEAILSNIHGLVDFFHLCKEGVVVLGILSCYAHECVIF